MNISKSMIRVIWADWCNHVPTSNSNANKVDRFFEQTLTADQRPDYLKAIEKAGNAAEIAFRDSMAKSGF